MAILQNTRAANPVLVTRWRAFRKICDQERRLLKYSIGAAKRFRAPMPIKSEDVLAGKIPCAKQQRGPKARVIGFKSVRF
jgi:hypothetical protein